MKGKGASVMRIAGMICECNPLHAGHQYLMEQAKRGGADVLIALMSGCFVERGEPAVADGFVRAKALLAGGADVVLELPFPFSASSAEHFARAGVEILSRLGVHELWFGSECGSIETLSTLAGICDSPEFVARYAASVRSNGGSAKKYFEILSDLSGKDCACSPNDILGIAYLRAIRTFGSAMIPRTVQRLGSGYSERRLNAECPSATALRIALAEGGIDAVSSYLAPTTRSSLAEALEEGRAPAGWKHAERLILGALRMLSDEEIASIAELSGGLGARLRDAARKADSFEALLALVATKKYTTARIQRGILYALTGIRDEDLRAPCTYVRLLGANEVGRRALAACKRTSAIPVVTRRQDVPAEGEAQCRLAERAWKLYTLCLPRSASASDYWRKKPILLPKEP